MAKTKSITRELPAGFVLGSGAHASIEAGMCIMEAVSYVAGEPWSDHPKCSSRVAASLCRSFNDRLKTDARRTELLGPLVPRLVGTAGSDELEWRRLWMVFDFNVRVGVPLVLEAYGHKKEADELRGLVEIVDRSSAMQARDGIRAIRALALDRALALALDRALDLALDLARARARAIALALALEEGYTQLIVRLIELR